MKLFATALFLALFSTATFADESVNLFAGVGAVGSSSRAASASAGLAGSAIFGAGSANGSSGAGNRSYANLGIVNDGLTSSSGSVGETYNTTEVFSFGAAGALGAAGGQQQGSGNARGVFGTLGLGLPDGLF